MNYENFGVEDLVLDEAFRDWVQNASSQKHAFWEKWLAAHPEKVRDVEEARRIILSIDFRDELSAQEQLDVWRKIELSTLYRSQQITGKRNLFNAIWRNGSLVYQVAAALTLLFVCAALYVAFTGTQEYRTAYGEIQKITLPDGSQVTLNANSSLRYDKEWSDKENREVWLEGEAFFSVTKQHATLPSGKVPVKFTVHTQDLEVQVLGTRFNVQHREEETKVSLNEGKVKVQLPKNKMGGKVAAENSEITLVPGQLVAYSAAKKQFTRKQINPVVYSAWTNRKYIFQNTTLREIVTMLENNYGVQVTVQDPALLDQRLTGTVLSDNLGTMLRALSATADLDVEQNQKQIILRRKE